MPRIPVAIAVLALTVAAVGWNMARYRAVWEMFPRQGPTTNSPQSNGLEPDGSETGHGPADAAGVQDMAIGPEPAAAQSLPAQEALGQRAVLIIEQPRAGSSGDLSAPAAMQSEGATAHMPAAEQMPARGLMSAAEQMPPAGPATSALSGTPATDAVIGGVVGGWAAAPDQATPDQAAPQRGPSARVVGLAAVAVAQRAAPPEVMLNGSLAGVPGGLSSNLPAGLRRLPPVSAGPAQLPELQCTTPGTPIPVYPSSGVE